MQSLRQVLLHSYVSVQQLLHKVLEQKHVFAIAGRDKNPGFITPISYCHSEVVARFWPPSTVDEFIGTGIFVDVVSSMSCTTSER